MRKLVLDNYEPWSKFACRRWIRFIKSMSKLPTGAYNLPSEANISNIFPKNAENRDFKEHQNFCIWFSLCFPLKGSSFKGISKGLRVWSSPGSKAPNQPHHPQSRRQPKGGLGRAASATAVHPCISPHSIFFDLQDTLRTCLKWAETAHHKQTDGQNGSG